MLNKLKTRKQEGFTIIEVLIVLAIAGLIIAIVLFAVPNLQKSGRNTAIKNDASALAGAIGDFESNNNGAVPTKGTFGNGQFALANATITTGGTAKLQGATNVMNVNTGTATFAATTPPVAGAQVTAGNLYVDTGEGCQTTSGTAPIKSSRAFAIYYWTEASGVVAGADGTTGIVNGAGLKGQCLDS